MKIAVIGGNEFVVGFELAGIKQVIESDENPFRQMKSLVGSKEIGIVVVDEKIMDGLASHERLQIESCVEPVFLPLSQKAEQGNLRRLIKKSIGVDLWK